MSVTTGSLIIATAVLLVGCFLEKWLKSRKDSLDRIADALEDKKNKNERNKK